MFRAHTNISLNAAGLIDPIMNVLDTRLQLVNNRIVHVLMFCFDLLGIVAWGDAKLTSLLYVKQHNL